MAQEADLNETFPLEEENPLHKIQSEDFEETDDLDENEKDLIDDDE